MKTQNGITYACGSFVRFFRNTDRASGRVNGIFREDGGEEIILSGEFDPSSTDASAGSRLACAMTRQDKPFRGMDQYRARHLCAYQGGEDMERWLCSPDFKGIGKAGAGRLVRFAEDYAGDGANLWNLAVCDPKALEGSGVPAKAVETACRVMSAGELTKASVRARFPSVTWEMAEDMIGRLGRQFWTVVYVSPYSLLEAFSDKCWATWARIDRLALEAGMSPDSPERIEAGTYHIVRSVVIGRGDTRVCLDDPAAYGGLVAKVLRDMGFGWDRKADVERRLWEELTAGTRLRLRTEGGLRYCCMADLLKCEERAARNLLGMASEPPLYDAGLATIVAKMEEYERETGFELDGDQRMAVVRCLTSRVSLVTGGPGRGKTAVLGCLAYIWSTSGIERYDVRPMAPTWLAAHRIDASIRDVAKLVSDYRNHDKSRQYDSREMRKAEAVARVIYAAYAKKENNEGRTAWDGIRKDEYRGLAFIDEASMVDARQLDALLDIFRYSQVVFLGDSDQLPSIGPGDVLRNMCGSSRIPHSRLTIGHRSNRFAVLQDNADRIRDGSPIEDLDWSSDLFRMQTFDHMCAGTKADPPEMQAYIVDRYAYYVSEAETAGGGMRDVCVVCAYSLAKHGPCSAEGLNLAIQDRMNPERKGGKDQTPGKSGQILTDKDDHGVALVYVKYGDRAIRMGDRVMYRRNLPDRGITNGDCGTVIEYKPGLDATDPVGFVKLALDDGRTVMLAGTEAGGLQLAYAVTVHKSQGCEFKYVIFAASHKLAWDRQGFASRNLFYTAATRTKMQLEIVGYADSVRKCVSTAPAPRQSSLLHLLANG